MDDEHRKAYALALRFGAKKTAARIRAHKISIGGAILMASREIGTRQTITALFEAKEPRWSFCAIRYVEDIERDELRALSKDLRLQDIEHAAWALKGRFLSGQELGALRWISNLTPTA